MLLLLIPLAIILWQRSKPLSWWNPVSWWNDSVNLAGGAIDQLKEWVLGIVRNAVGLVEHDLSDAINFMGTLASNAIGAVLGEVHRLEAYADTIWSWAQAGISDAVRWAAALYDKAVGIAQYLYGAAVNVAQQLTNDVRGWAAAAVRFVESEALTWARQVQTWANDAIGFAAKTAEAALIAAERLILTWIKAAYDAVYKAVAKDFIYPILMVLDWVKKAWDWVVWFAEHPFAIVHDVETDVINWADHLPADMQHAVESQGFIRGMEAMGKYLGG